MKDNDRRKIQRNLIRVKEALSNDLPYIIDRLIQEEIFSFEIKDEIDSAVPPTLQQKAHVFIMKLIRSGDQSYPVFTQILADRGFEDVVSLMENTSLDVVLHEVETRVAEEVEVITVRHSKVENAENPIDGQQTFTSITEQSAACGENMTKIDRLEEELAAFKQEFVEKMEAYRKEVKEDNANTIKMITEAISESSEDSMESNQTKKSLLKLLKERNKSNDSLMKENCKLKKGMKKSDFDNKILKQANLKLDKENEEIKSESAKKDGKIHDLTKRVKYLETRIKNFEINKRNTTSESNLLGWVSCCRRNVIKRFKTG